jgi:DNA topoisomerase-1
MAESLVIVESPAKAKTIEKFLGKGFKVVASYGHVRSLPSKKGSVDVENDFAPVYKVIENKQKYIDAIKKEMKGVKRIYIATDLDREGEAIAWHLTNVLDIDNGNNIIEVHRIIFSEITKNAIEEAINNPRKISRDLVDAQRAREILDYLVGFNLSPFLWKKVRYGLSAGRVQSVALRMIVEREKGRKAFTAKEYWSIEGIFSDEKEYNPFQGTLNSKDGTKYKKHDITTESDAIRIVEEIEGKKLHVENVNKKNIKRNPPPAFITSTLQQEASRKLGYTAKKTMTVAQKLYEGKQVGDAMVGLITYMRTDSVKMAESALEEAQRVITDLYGEDYALDSPRHFKKKSKGAQEAHEAIRPTALSRTPKSIKKYVTPDEFKLYDLIWKRAVASQMAQMILESISADIASENGYSFRATGSRVTFPGYAKVYTEGKDDTDDEQETILPPLEVGQSVAVIGIVPEQHFTTPPPRYSEATLIKALEDNGIGRPSTYAGIISTLQTRKYVTLKEKRFYPEDVGVIVSDLLVDHFTRYVDYGFTAHMEVDLDHIAEGNTKWRPVIKEFWDPFITLLKKKDKEVKKEDVYTQKTDKTCPTCGKPVVIKLGRFGRFYACSGYPECNYTASLEEKDEEIPEVNETCEKCNRPMEVKIGKYGHFLGCSGYPECKNIRSLEKPLDTGVPCPECGAGTMIERVVKKGRGKGKKFYGCSAYPKCTYILNDRPYQIPCPKCASPFMVHSMKKGESLLVCPAEGCGYTEEVSEKKLEKEAEKKRV